MRVLQKSEENNEWCNILAQLKTYLKYKTTSLMQISETTNHKGLSVLGIYFKAHHVTHTFATVYLSRYWRVMLEVW